MNEADALDLVQRATWTVIIGSSPAIVTAMVVGLTISLIQALTQIQEMTLTFVPKIVAIFLASIVGATFMGAQIGTLATTAFSHIERGF
ncbi:MAG: flagellar biosynthetic protein FliQ [Ahrensia sp.]|nr:flagellar biosynthetic protein FliQ [Ahrensia sp.]